MRTASNQVDLTSTPRVSLCPVRIVTQLSIARSRWRRDRWMRQTHSHTVQISAQNKRAACPCTILDDASLLLVHPPSPLQDLNFRCFLVGPSSCHSTTNCEIRRETRPETDSYRELQVDSTTG